MDNKPAEDKSEDKSEDKIGDKTEIPRPPRGLAVIMVLGPGLVWCAEYIGSGEVILATRTGAILGLMALWVPILAVFAKFWIGLAGARYTVCTGEGMIDMMSRTPGPRNWVIWIVFVGQVCSGAIATGALANAAAIFAHYFIPWIPQHVLGWIIVLFVISLVWSGKFEILKKIMAVLIVLIIVGILDVARVTWPGWGKIFMGAFGFQVPDIPAWALGDASLSGSPWAEILPLLGWAAGGFASQVWYTYWVMGAGYGMARGRGYGKPLDPKRLKEVSVEEAKRLKGWCKVVYTDAILATVVGIVIIAAFMIAGAGVLRPAQIAPEKADVALELSRIFSERWGSIGAHLFILAGLAAMISTLLGQFAGWPRLLADCARILIPGVSRFSWKVQFRTIMVIYALSNMILVYEFKLQPVILVKIGAILDGMILTPLQALAVGLTLYLVMPKFFSEEARRILKPSRVFAFGLGLAFIVYGYFCVFQIPGAFKKKDKEKVEKTIQEEDKETERNGQEPVAMIRLPGSHDTYRLVMIEDQALSRS